MIVSQVAGQPVVGQLSIFVTVVLAALLHSAGRTVRRRLPRFVPLSGGVMIAELLEPASDPDSELELDGGDDPMQKKSENVAHLRIVSG